MTKSIVLTVCEEMGITPEEFFGPRRLKHLTHARRTAIDRMMAEGFSMTGIAAAIKRNRTTIGYWLHPEYRKRRSEYFKGYHAAHPVPRVRKLQREKIDRLLEVYLTQGLEAAKPIAHSYGINPLTICRYSKALGIKGKPGRPRKIVCPNAAHIQHEMQP